MRSGGAERVMANLANHFVKHGHKVSLILMTPKNEKPFYSLEGTIEVISLNNLSFNKSIIIRLKDIICSILFLRRELKRLKPDRIISFLETVNMAAILANIGNKCPHIISERTHPKYHIIPKFYQWMRLKLYPLCTKLVVQTQTVYDYFPETFKDFMAIIPNPVAEPIRTKNSQQNIVETIVSVGRLGNEKDHPTLIKAFKRYKDSNPEAKLVIYGEGANRQLLEGLIQEFSLQDDVTLYGKHPNIIEVLLKADLFVFPSLYEGFPNALCEAMSVGLPVIASNVTGNRDVVKDNVNGLLFEAQNVADLVRKMFLMNDLALRQSLSDEAKKIAEDYSQEKIYKLWDDLCVE